MILDLLSGSSVRKSSVNVMSPNAFSNGGLPGAPAMRTAVGVAPLTTSWKKKCSCVLFSSPKLNPFWALHPIRRKKKSAQKKRAI